MPKKKKKKSNNFGRECVSDIVVIRLSVVLFLPVVLCWDNVQTVVVSVTRGSRAE